GWGRSSAQEAARLVGHRREEEAGHEVDQLAREEAVVLARRAPAPGQLAHREAQRVEAPVQAQGLRGEQRHDERSPPVERLVLVLEAGAVEERLGAVPQVAQQLEVAGP